MTAKLRSNGVLAYSAAIIAIIGALGVAVVNAIVAFRTSAKVEDVGAKVEVVTGKVAEVHSLADGNLSKVSAELKTANELAAKNGERVVALEALLIDRFKTPLPLPKP